MAPPKELNPAVMHFIPNVAKVPKPKPKPCKRSTPLRLLDQTLSVHQNPPKPIDANLHDMQQTSESAAPKDTSPKVLHSGEEITQMTLSLTLTSTTTQAPIPTNINRTESHPLESPVITTEERASAPLQLTTDKSPAKVETVSLHSPMAITDKIDESATLINVITQLQQRCNQLWN